MSYSDKLLKQEITIIDNGVKTDLETKEDTPILDQEGHLQLRLDSGMKRRLLQTLHKLQEYITWPGIQSYVKNYVKGCPHCQQNKIRRQPFKPPLQPILGPKTLRPFAHISMDLITDLPESRGFDSILSMVDHRLTKGMILIPTMS